ncbi:MAG: hypothetical protein JXB08_01010 [Bacilli bacterium]|nr:hypothetical protein [Bacilli bacterium]
MKASKTTQNIRSITLQAMLLAVLVVQEYILTGIPQVQLTVILILVYARFLSYQKLVPLVVMYVLLDNLLMGSFSLLYTPTMLIIWPLFAIFARMLRDKQDYISLLYAIVFSFVYGWAYLPASIIVMHLDTWTKIYTYFLADLPAELIMAVNTVVTFLVFYKPMNELMTYLFRQVFPEYPKPDQMDLN